MEHDLSRVVDALPGLVWTALPDGQIDFVNQRWCEYTGLRTDEAYPRVWEAATHPEDRPELLKHWRSILISGEPRQMEARLRRFDGEYRRFLCRTSSLADESGQIVKWCGINIDIEELGQSDEAVRAREHHYRAIADSVPAMIAFMTPAGEVEFVNRHVLDYFGVTLEALKHWSSSDSVHPDDLPAVNAAWVHSVKTEEPFEIEQRLRRSDATYHWFRVQGLPLRGTDGRVAGWYVLQTDIDERKRAEALLAGEKRLLELVAGGQPIAIILSALCLLVESSDEGGYCGVVVIDSSGTSLQCGAAPSLPVSFITSTERQPINMDSSPSAMAVQLNEPVIAADLTSETRWTGTAWCQMVLEHGLRACWATPITSTTGKVLGALEIYYDAPRTPAVIHENLIQRFTNIASIVVERAQSNAALKLSEARKAAILDSSLDCIVTMDHEGRITEFNPAAERTFGYRRDKVVGERLADTVVPPPLRDKHGLGLARYLATSEAHVLGRRVEMSAVRADGSEFPVELTISRIPLDGPPSFTGYMRDITERKRSEEELRRSEAFLAEAQRLSFTGSFSWAVAAGEIVWSEQLYRIFEFDSALPVTLERIISRVHPDDLPTVNEMIDRAGREARDFEHEHRLLMPDRSVKYLRMVAHGTRDQDGQQEYIGAIQDITERRAAEEALGKARSELAHVARSTSLGVLTASIAHEVNQPLSGIITNANTCLRMLAADPPNIEGARETARRTIRDGNRASQVITRLRALYGKKAITTESVDLNEATSEVVALSLSELQRNRVVLRTELAGDLAPVTGDRVQLQQVILNLILNASEAMSGVDDRPRHLLVKTERDGQDRLRLAAQDAGVGFEPQSMDRLFEPFYTTKSNGMGIGLSVSRSIIESHHGSLWAEPNAGPGATFLFSLPRGTVPKTAAQISP